VAIGMGRALNKPAWLYSHAGSNIKSAPHLNTANVMSLFYLMTKLPISEKCLFENYFDMSA
jgi:hypothetical protein